MTQEITCITSLQDVTMERPMCINTLLRPQITMYLYAVGQWVSGPQESKIEICFYKPELEVNAREQNIV